MEQLRTLPPNDSAFLYRIIVFSAHCFACLPTNEQTGTLLPSPSVSVDGRVCTEGVS